MKASMKQVRYKVPPPFHVSHNNHSRPDPGRGEKINLNFCFHTYLWCFKMFYEGLKGFYKTFCGTTKKCENEKFK